jgi:hypothetical protein
LSPNYLFRLYALSIVKIWLSKPITIAPDAEVGVGASKNGKNGAKTCQAFILFFSGETIKTTKALIETEASLSLDLKEALDQLLYVTKLMFDRLLNYHYCP